MRVPLIPNPAIAQTSIHRFALTTERASAHGQARSILRPIRSDFPRCPPLVGTITCAVSPPREAIARAMSDSLCPTSSACRWSASSVSNHGHPPLHRTAAGGSPAPVLQRHLPHECSTRRGDGAGLPGSPSGRDRRFHHRSVTPVAMGHDCTGTAGDSLERTRFGKKENPDGHGGKRN